MISWLIRLFFPDSKKAQATKKPSPTQPARRSAAPAAAAPEEPAASETAFPEAIPGVGNRDQDPGGTTYCFIDRL